VAVAAWGEPDNAVVTPELARWTLVLVQRGRAESDAHQRLQKNERGRREVDRKVLEIITRAGKDGIRESDMPVKCPAFRALNEELRSELLGRLAHEDEIACRRGKRGAKYLYLPKHAPEDAGRLFPVSLACSPFAGTETYGPMLSVENILGEHTAARQVANERIWTLSDERTAKFPYEGYSLAPLTVGRRMRAD
jgi:hypothetical protein